MKTLLWDTETNGLIRNSLTPLARQPRIIELFCLILEDEVEVSTYHSLFSIGEKLSEEITSITGLKDADLASAPKWMEEAPKIKSMFESVDEVVAHNLKFDASMVDNEMKRVGSSIVWPDKICTVEATEWIKGFRLSLSALHEYLFETAFTGAHRAEVDVRALARCFIELRQRRFV